MSFEWKGQFTENSLNTVLGEVGRSYKEEATRIHANRTHQKQWQSITWGLGLVGLMGMHTTPVINQASTSWDFGHSWGGHSAVDALFSLAVPGLAAGVLLAHRWWSNGQLVKADVADATQWFLNTGAAAVGLSMMNRVVTEHIGITAASDIATGLVFNSGFAEQAMMFGGLVGHGVLAGMGAATVLVAMHLVVSAFRAGLEKSIEAYQLTKPHESAGAKTQRVLGAFAKGLGEACVDFFRRDLTDTRNLWLGSAGLIALGTIARVGISMAMASGVGALPLAGIIGAVLLVVAGFNYYVVNNKVKPKSEIQKIVDRRFFTSKSPADPSVIQLDEDDEMMGRAVVTSASPSTKTSGWRGRLQGFTFFDRCRKDASKDTSKDAFIDDPIRVGFDELQRSRLDAEQCLLGVG